MSPALRMSYVSAFFESCVVVLLPFFVLCPYVGAKCSPPPPITFHFADAQFVNFTLTAVSAVKMFQIIVVLSRCGIII